MARRLLRELAAAGFAPDDVGVCIGDGAAWLRRLYAEWFPKAVAIVDFFHAAEYVWAAARARSGTPVPSSATHRISPSFRDLRAGAAFPAAPPPASPSTVVDPDSAASRGLAPPPQASHA